MEINWFLLTGELHLTVYIQLCSLLIISKVKIITELSLAQLEERKTVTVAIKAFQRYLEARGSM
jgi:hypothetical protein